jgi:AcrR family transcriptional regulator
MTRDAQRTRRLLLEAAVQEFADKGFAGARINVIAERAGVNKERIYQYYGDKDGLFSAVLSTELDRVVEAVPVAATGPADLADYVGRMFDHYATRPYLARLLYWEGLERDADAAVSEERTARYQAKVDDVLTALAGRGCSRQTAAHVLFAMIALVTSEHALPQLSRMVLGSGAGRDRAAVVAVARGLAAVPGEAPPASR